jgi:hypothetical protein
VNGNGTHGVDCSCTRCLGFQPGNDVALRHGVDVSPLRLSDRTMELEAAIRDAMPHYRPAFAMAVQAAAIAGARLERAEAALETASDAEQAERLGVIASRWWNNWTKQLERLGLSPKSAAALGLALEFAAGAKTRREQLAARYRPNGDGGDAS